ncbi:MAG: hypothetical protein ACREEY_04555, partial [Brevundimonas sp.]
CGFGLSLSTRSARKMEMERIRIPQMFRAMLSIAVLATATGCQHLGDAAISGPLGSPEIQARASGAWKRKMPCLNQVTITAGDTQMWRISSLNGDCVEVRRLQYGVVPVGFTQEGEAKPLQQGVAYGASVGGWTAAMPNVPFQAWGRFVFEDGRWSRLSGLAAN